MKFDGPGADMLKSLAPHSLADDQDGGGQHLAVLAAAGQPDRQDPGGAAMLHTTIAPTMLKGSPKENVLPQDATAWINYRIAPGDSSAEVMAGPRSAVGDLPVKLAWVKAPGRAQQGLVDQLGRLEDPGRPGRRREQGARSPRP
jgi:carboxypeptidase PM20D1